MKIYILADKDGGILEIFPEKNWDNAYNKTVAQNNGEILIELSKYEAKEISRLCGIIYG